MGVIEQLGALALASRLKRLAERLSRDVSRIYAEHEIDFHARWFPLMYLLSHQSRLAITQIADELGMTHPSVNQIAGQMSRHGLLKISGDSSDGRKRLLSLSPRGRAVARRLQSVWDVIEEVNNDLLTETGGGLLKQLILVEQALNGNEMYDRVRERLRRTGKENKTHNSSRYRRTK